MEFYANLHLHSTHSDGALTPEELVIAAKGEGYKALAITDHDTATAYGELVEACKKHDMECIFGTEFSVYEPIATHLVAFHYDPEYPEMKKYLEDMAQVTVITTKGCFDEAVEKGNISGITWQEVLDYNKGIKWLCNNHVFRAMQAKGLVDESEYMAWFLLNFEAQRFKYKPDFEFLTLPQIIDLVHRAGGIALVAHPSDEHLDNIEKIVEWGIDGIEVEHPDLNREQRIRAMEIAKKYNFLISGGSDHSGVCSGLYGSYPTEEELKKSRTYIEPLSSGTSYEYYMEIKNRQEKLMKRKIAFSCGPLQHMFSDKEALKIAKEIGADAVDFDLASFTVSKSETENIYQKSDEEIIAYFNSLRDYAKEIGIEICQTHGRLNGYSLDEAEKKIFLQNSRLDCLATAALGCEYTVFHSVNSARFGADTPAKTMHKLNFDMFTSILPFAKKYGVKIATETFGDCAKYNCCDFFGNIKEFLITYNIIANVDDFKDHFVMCADTGHSNKAMRYNNPNPADVIRMLGSPLKVLHLNDNDTHTDQHKIPFTGCIDWDDVFDALDEIGYDGVYNMELCLNRFGDGIEVETAAYAICVLRNYLNKRYGE